jgi:hypothetical protein
VFKNRVEKKIFVAKSEGVIRSWIKLDHKGFHELFSSPNIITAIKSRMVRWAGHVACTGEDICIEVVGKLE